MQSQNLLLGPNGQPLLSSAPSTPAASALVDAHGAPIARTVPAAPSAPRATRTATQPTKAAVASGTVGAYSLVDHAGTWHVYNTATGEPLSEVFADRGDAAWYAQRRTRLAEILAEKGRLFQPKIELPAGWQIAGAPGALVLLDDRGVQVGPVWTDRTNGRVDAFRYAQRVTRKGGAA